MESGRPILRAICEGWEGSGSGKRCSPGHTMREGEAGRPSPWQPSFFARRRPGLTASTPPPPLLPRRTPPLRQLTPPPRLTRLRPLTQLRRITRLRQPILLRGLTRLRALIRLRERTPLRRLIGLRCIILQPSRRAEAGLPSSPEVCIRAIPPSVPRRAIRQPGAVPYIRVRRMWVRALHGLLIRDLRRQRKGRPAIWATGSTSTTIFPSRSRSACCAASPASTGSLPTSSSG